MDEDIGVGMSKAELEPDETDDIDVERPRPKREAIGMGSEWWTLSEDGLMPLLELEDILAEM